jgi:hypothetical protein
LYDCCAVGIGQDNAAEKKISILKALEPCLIGAKIGDRGFDLDDRDPALPVESDHIDPAARLQGEFSEATFAALREES